MCLCGENGAAKETEVGFLVLVVQTVALFTKNLRGSFDGFFLIEFNAQHAALVLPVMDDADVFDTDIFQGENRSHGCNLTGFVGNVDGNGIGTLQRTAGGIDEGITVDSGTVEQLVQIITAFGV